MTAKHRNILCSSRRDTVDAEVLVAVSRPAGRALASPLAPFYEHIGHRPPPFLDWVWSFLAVLNTCNTPTLTNRMRHLPVLPRYSAATTSVGAIFTSNIFSTIGLPLNTCRVTSNHCPLWTNLSSLNFTVFVTTCRPRRYTGLL
jgi:hypothetical protein